ncbi:MAG: hypothetical protein JXB38_09955, partial [Anaerolineales bacterium]|nr:hypothetical protein [Anaerolineales bacterium]
APSQIIVSASGDTIAYNGPGKDYAAVATLYQTQELDCVGRSADGEWIVFLLADNRTAWVNAENLLINFDPYTLESIEAPPTQEIMYKLLIVNNTEDAWFISIPEADIPATNVAESASLVFELPAQTYHVVVGGKRGGESKLVTLNQDITVKLNTSSTQKLLITVE